jgi:hypothetical protein
MKKTISNLFLLFFLMGCSILSDAQVQRGMDIDGEMAADESGFSVSLADPYTIAVGARRNTGNGSNAGHVRVFSWDGSSWEQKGEDIDGEASDDQSGFVVDMPDSNTVAIGARLNDDNGTDAGHVRIYHWIDNEWTQKGPDIDGEAAGDNSGWSLSMCDANTVAIGAHSNNGGATSSGHVRVYTWDGTAWIQQGTDIDGEMANDDFGYSVSLSDPNTLAVGARSSNGNGSSSGHASVYHFNGTDWIQKGINIIGVAEGDQFGQSVSLPDSNTLAVGAPGNDANGAGAGQVRIFSWDGTSWGQKGANLDGEAASDQFGYNLSMADSNTLAIGGRNNDENGENSGHVRIYKWKKGMWSQEGIDINGESGGDLSGFSVDMPHPSVVAVGAFRNDGNGVDAGHARVFCLTNHDSLTVTACESYASPSGKFLDVTGVYMDTLINSAGCDSMFTIDLTVVKINNAVTRIDKTLKSEAIDVSYQWVVCPENTPINGEVNQTLTPSTDGSYAVILSKNGCLSVSACKSNLGLSVLQNSTTSPISVYPNPTSDIIHIQMKAEFSGTKYTLYSSTGIAVLSGELEGVETTINLKNLAEGLYLISLGDEAKQTVRVIKE